MRLRIAGTSREFGIIGINKNSLKYKNIKIDLQAFSLMLLNKSPLLTQGKVRFSFQANGYIRILHKPIHGHVDTFIVH